MFSSKRGGKMQEDTKMMHRYSLNLNNVIELVEVFSNIDKKLVLLTICTFQIAFLTYH